MKFLCLLAASVALFLGGGGADTTPPTLVSATVNTLGTTLTLIFSEAVYDDAWGSTISDSGGAFTFTNDQGGGGVNSGATWSYLSGTGTTIIVTNVEGSHGAAGVNLGDSLVVSYTIGLLPIVDLAGNQLENISNFPVQNNSTQQ